MVTYGTIDNGELPRRTRNNKRVVIAVACISALAVVCMALLASADADPDALLWKTSYEWKGAGEKVLNEWMESSTATLGPFEDYKWQGKGEAQVNEDIAKWDSNFE